MQVVEALIHSRQARVQLYQGVLFAPPQGAHNTVTELVRCIGVVSVFPRVVRGLCPSPLSVSCRATSVVSLGRPPPPPRAVPCRAVSCRAPFCCCQYRVVPRRALCALQIVPFFRSPPPCPMLGSAPCPFPYVVNPGPCSCPCLRSFYGASMVHCPFLCVRVPFPRPILGLVLVPPSAAPGPCPLCAPFHVLLQVLAWTWYCAVLCSAPSSLGGSNNKIGLS